MIPWESAHSGLADRWWATVRNRALFDEVAPHDQPMVACLFSATSGAIVSLAICVMALAGAVIAGGAAASVLPARFATWLSTALASWGLSLWATYSASLVIAAALLGFIAPWIAGGMHHLFLLLFAAVPSDRGYAHSVRVNAYVSGSTAAWLLVPLVGPLLWAAAHANGHVSGYGAVHRCSSVKAWLAYMLPTLGTFCCAGAIVLSSS